MEHFIEYSHDEGPSLTKILATLGPATDTDEVVGKLAHCGASVFRLNFSHGTASEHLERLRRVRRVSENTGIPLAVLGDLPGPKLRITTVPGEGIPLRTGQDVVLRAELDEAHERDGRVHVGCNYEPIAREVQLGHRVLINDGRVRMLVVDKEPDALICRVIHAGLITSRKGLNLPDTDLSASSLTDNDEVWVRWAVENDLDYLGLSFVRKGEDISNLRRRVTTLCEGESCGTALDEDPTSRIPIIAKIETPQAVRNFREIVQEADAIMVARGDLGVEMEIAEVPAVQKRLILDAHAYGKPCIVATQMLETMINSPVPTRAEVSDVANAILDGADAVMLSGETAVGQFPDLAVDTMRRVALATEASAEQQPTPPNPPAELRERRERTPALAHGAWHMAHDVSAKVMVVWSQDGASARYLSRYDFSIPIIAYSSSKRAVRRMCLLQGVQPVLHLHPPEHRSDFAAIVDKYLIESGIAEPGAPVILIGGKPLEDPRSTNTVAIRYLGELAGASARHERQEPAHAGSANPA